MAFFRRGFALKTQKTAKIWGGFLTAVKCGDKLNDWFLTQLAPHQVPLILVQSTTPGFFSPQLPIGSGEFGSIWLLFFCWGHPKLEIGISGL
jgi:hypothetical protein